MSVFPSFDPATARGSCLLTAMLYAAVLIQWAESQSIPPEHEWETEWETPSASWAMARGAGPSLGTADKDEKIWAWERPCY